MGISKRLFALICGLALACTVEGCIVTIDPVDLSFTDNPVDWATNGGPDTGPTNR